MPEALALVKRELGPDAVILGTRTLPAGQLGRLSGRERVEITAGPPGVAGPIRTAAVRERPADAIRAAAVPLAADVPSQLYPYYVQLVQNEVAEALARQWVQEADRSAASGESREQSLRRVVRAHIARLAPPVEAPDRRSPAHRKVALVGPPGSGKTTTLAKLAAHHHARGKLSVAILSLDSNRLGAIEQLRIYARVLGIPLHTAQSLAEVKTALEQTRDVARLLIDTPGIGLRDQGRFARVAALLRAIRPDEVHLVLPVSTLPETQDRLAQSFRALGTTRVLLTRLDEVVGFGVLINTAQRLQLGISYVTNGQSIPQDLSPASETNLAEVLLSASE